MFQRAVRAMELSALGTKAKCFVCVAEIMFTIVPAVMKPRVWAPLAMANMPDVPAPVGIAGAAGLVVTAHINIPVLARAIPAVWVRLVMANMNLVLAPVVISGMVVVALNSVPLVKFYTRI